MVRWQRLIDRPVKEDGGGRRKNGRFGTARCARYYRAIARQGSIILFKGAVPAPLENPPPSERAERAGLRWAADTVTLAGSGRAVKAGLGTLGARSAALGGGSRLTPWAEGLDAIRPGALDGRRQIPGER
jgi:hypothetical protein